MIKQLIRLANHLDNKGFQKEADYLDRIISKYSQEQLDAKEELESDDTDDSKTVGESAIEKLNQAESEE